MPGAPPRTTADTPSGRCRAGQIYTQKAREHNPSQEPPHMIDLRPHRAIALEEVDATAEETTL